MKTFLAKQSACWRARRVTGRVAGRGVLRDAFMLACLSFLSAAIPFNVHAAAASPAAANSAAAGASANAANAVAGAPQPTAPTPKSAAAAANAESAAAAPPAANSVNNAGSTPAAGTSPGSSVQPSASGKATGPASPSVTGGTKPPATAAASVPYSPNNQLRYGGYLVFRNLIPSPMLEAQAAEEFSQIVYGAEHANRLYDDADAHVTRVRSIVDKMVPYSLKWNERAKGWKWDVAVVRSPDIRMYCLPGGKIVVYGGLLDRARLNDNELGMLIGHEIAHALREHARERLGQLQGSQLASSGTISQLFGLADLGAAPLGIGSRLLEMKYENTDETEADVIGSDIASRAGFDPRAAVTLWDKLAQATRSSREQGFIYVHPYSQSRRQDIIKRLPDMLPLYAKAIGKTVDALPDYAGMGRPRRKLARD
ncbi:M48 family metallopeptidase [Paraburkholderia phenoliruptrix]|uniref:M48 family metallopeptidase n=1 Tax=Paraburkholderia phenoliruptrix TaxID=252970 RepID=UPI001C4F6677|nr:M48 family metallopeptidase [Paraburkholderia phenoliruptrix]MBW9098071.1 M48 family metallopeptidase [Paraburkholderia phenoliruptrix]